MGLTPEDLRELLAAFEESSWREMSVSVSGDTLHVSRRDASHAGGVVAAASEQARPPAAAQTPPTDAVAPAPVTDSPAAAVGAHVQPPQDAPGTPVLAPSVGLFWRAPSPDAPPFVEVGTRVGPEDTVGIVEVMKLMNRVPAGVAGVVTSVLVPNGGMVEHGQPLVMVNPS
jgi:acetyl-CoA carboxylase biotin carboxyl carrier protein